ncbi:MAG: glycerophosphodiester phosphodiesterase family protein [Granulosicoccaceae bacterium]
MIRTKLKTFKRINQLVITVCLLLTFPIMLTAADSIDVGDRPAQIIAELPDGELRAALGACAANAAVRSDFSIGHRGAPFKYPEHTREGYIAAANSGAGIIECDVTFTKDRALVCRHSQCDLHSSTNILQTPLAQKCSVPPDMNNDTPFSDVKCCTSDLTVAEFKTLNGRFDKANKKAKTLEDYLSLKNTPHAEATEVSGTLMTHAESIELFSSLGVKMIPELKAADVPMPFTAADGEEWTQEHYAQALVDEYLEQSVEPVNVFLQSFNLDDVKYWLSNTPQFGKQAAWLDGRYRDRSFKVNKPKTWKPSMEELAQAGVPILAPPMWMLLTLDDDDNIVPSKYAIAAKASGLDLIGWTLERSGPLSSGGGWYYQTIKPAIKNDGAIYQTLHVLAQDVGVKGMFSDWPATSSYYANCFGIK